MSKLVSTYINYGVSVDCAVILERINIPMKTFRATSKKILIETYGLEEKLINEVKEAIQRQPIEDDILNVLLENSNFTCCLCKGVKGKSYIIHHIIEYSKTQDNTYSNLAVLCPVCHDIAHNNGGGLTNSISAKAVVRLKEKWEAEVEKINMEAASRSGDISEIDFINIPRICDLALELFQTIPETTTSERLIGEGIISSQGELKIEGLKKWSGEHGRYYFDFVFSSRVKFHFYEIFKKTLSSLQFKNLDDLLNFKSLKSSDIIGTYCFYVGGLYGTRPETPINESSPMTHLYFKRKKLFIEWIIDPKYITSSSSISRFGTRTTYLVYGKIRDVKEIEIDGKKYLHIDIRPYVAGIPTKTVNRIPQVYWEKYTQDDFDCDLDEENSSECI